jgi:hypothetical protein
VIFEGRDMNGSREKALKRAAIPVVALLPMYPQQTAYVLDYAYDTITHFFDAAHSNSLPAKHMEPNCAAGSQGVELRERALQIINLPLPLDGREAKAVLDYARVLWEELYREELNAVAFDDANVLRFRG